MAFVQKIYDSSLQIYVYYTKAVIDETPAFNETIPNHSGNLVASTHAVVAETGATLTIKDEGSNLTVNTRSLDFVGAGVTSTFSEDDVTITVTGSGSLGAHAADHLSNQSDEINGDQLDIDFSPPTYTPSNVGGLTTSAQHLTSHLKGIDNYLAGLSLATGEVNTASNVGTGSGWFKLKNVTDLQFKSAKVGYGLALAVNTDDITFTSKTAVTTLTSSGSIAVDADLGPHYELTLGTSALIQNPTNTTVGKVIEMVVFQDGTGERQLTFDSNWVPVGKTFQIAQQPNSSSIIKATARGVSTKWYYTIEHAEFTEVTDTTITTNQNSWDPAGRKYANLIRASTNANTREVRGIVSPVAGFENSGFRMVLVDSNYLILKHEDSAASTTNRLFIQTGADLTLVPGDSVYFQYDLAIQRWRLV
jgi:hypothetical protein